MESIVVKESTIIRPANETPKHTLWLSSLDMLVPKIHVPTVYFYKSNGSSDFFDPASLKRALADVLVPFYPVAGRLGTDDSGRTVLRCNGEGVLFAQAEADFPMEDFGDFTPGSQFRPLIPVVDQSADNSLQPLLLLQVTSFKCGGICVGVGMHHVLTDGGSAIHLINTWSDIARGLPAGTPPFIDRTLLAAQIPPNPTFHHVEYDPPPSMNTQSQTPDLKSGYEPASTTTATLTLTLEQIKTLKSKSSNNYNDHGAKYTTYETLAAHVWRCACRARNLPADQPTKLYMPTDGRSRLRPPLPRGFLGNVLFASALVASAGEVESGPLSNTAGRIRKTLARMDNEYLRSALDFLEEQKDLTSLVRGARSFACPNLNVVSWTQLPVHNADFGWGRPIFMGPGSVVFEGMVYIIKSPAGGGSLAMFICLESKHMELFRKFFYEF